MTGAVPGSDQLAQYDDILVAFSGGKDRLACVLHLLDLGVSPTRIELHHHGGGPQFVDWRCTSAYCRAVAEALGLALFSSYREGGFRREMNRQAAPTAPVRIETLHGWIGAGGSGPDGTRGLFPQVSADLKLRWCSAYLKIDVLSVAIRNQARFRHGRTLVVRGERAEESVNRARYVPFQRHRTDTRDGAPAGRYVDHLRRVLHWSEGEVLDIIRRHGVISHVVYQLGWVRLSCMACIFGSPTNGPRSAPSSPRCSYRSPPGSTQLQDHSTGDERARGGKPRSTLPRCLSSAAAGRPGQERSPGLAYPRSARTMVPAARRLWRKGGRREDRDG